MGSSELSGKESPSFFGFDGTLISRWQRHYSSKLLVKSVLQNHLSVFPAFSKLSKGWLTSYSYWRSSDLSWSLSTSWQSSLQISTLSLSLLPVSLSLDSRLVDKNIVEAKYLLPYDFNHLVVLELFLHFIQQQKRTKLYLLICCLWGRSPPKMVHGILKTQ